MWPEDNSAVLATLSPTAKLVNEAMRHFAPAIVGISDIAKFALWAESLSLDSEKIASAFAELETAKFAVRVGGGWQLPSAACQLHGCSPNYSLKRTAANRHGVD